MDKTGSISGAQVALEEAMTAALDGYWRARGDGDEAAAAAFYHVLSVAKTNADALDVEFADRTLAKLDPDSLLLMVRPHA